MARTEIEKARIILKIDKLEKEKAKQESELKSMRSFHGFADAEYGSELCAGGMEADERRIEVKVEELEKKIAYLRDYLRNSRNLEADQRMLLNQIKELDDEIKTRENIRIAHQNTLIWVSFVLRVCRGEQ